MWYCSNVALPVYVTPQFSFSEGTGKFEVKVGPKQTMGKVVSSYACMYIYITIDSLVASSLLDIGIYSILVLFSHPWYPH